jgi:hypothetical protein
MAAPVARLLRWNDEAGQPEALTGHGTVHESERLDDERFIAP